MATAAAVMHPEMLLYDVVVHTELSRAVVCVAAELRRDCL
jgi:hypothetical protein